MSELKSTNPLALRYLITEDLYLLDDIPVTEHLKTEAAQPVENAPETPVKEFNGFDYLGENNKYFLLVVNEPSHKTMLPKELEALQSILSAKKMELKDVALLNLNNYPGATFVQMKSFFVCSKIVLFGISPQQIQLHSIPLNTPTDIQGTKILSTFSFSEMMDNLDKKKAFWAEMKGL